MTWRHRFEKIEGARDPAAEAPRPKPDLARFEGEPAPGEPGAGEPTPASPGPGAARTEAERLDAHDALVRALPTLVCPVCGGENSKFYPTCHTCGHRLDGDDAIEHNARRLEQFELERLKAEVALEKKVAPPPQVELTTEAAPASPWLPPGMSPRMATGVTLALLLVGPLARSGRLTLWGILAALGLWAWRWSAGPGGNR